MMPWRLSQAPLPPKENSKSRFHAGFSHKSRHENAWNSCSRLVYLITLDARSIFFSIQCPFSCSKICQIKPSRFRFEGAHETCYQHLTTGSNCFVVWISANDSSFVKSRYGFLPMTKNIKTSTSFYYISARPSSDWVLTLKT